MENKELFERKYKSNFDDAKNYIAQNNLTEAKNSFKRALEAAIKLVEQTSGKEKETYMKDATVVSDMLERINRKMSVSDQAIKPKAPVSESKSKEKDSQEDEPVERISLEEALAKLNELEGLQAVKTTVTEFINQVKVFEIRKKRKLPVPPTSYHLAFMGNAGSGKTTVARIMAQIYCAMGILSKGQLVEVKRNDLVAGYVGQTAIKTQEVIDRALGGVLFIDEAYMLYNKSGNDFGQEAIDTLLKAMEDNRDDFVVIVAGYEEETLEFIKSNPGLESRFKTFIYFTDYSGEEMYHIFERMCKKNAYIIGDGVKDILLEHFNYVYENRTRSTGNARYVRNTFEDAVKNQSTRVISFGDNVSDIELVTFLPKDFEFLN